ncbi:universal stress protein [Lachnospiraceae bacterium NSJ-143]|nr:universal stress protein [Lachnospiraceae bacterium NSJ-143]
MKKILLPIDGTRRSMESAEFITENYRPDEVDIEAITVREDSYAYAMSQIAAKRVERETMHIFDDIDRILAGYSVKKHVLVGRSAGAEIVGFAHENNIDMIVMTKSTKKGIKRFLGSVASYVVRHSGCTVFSVPERDEDAA